MHVIIYLNLNDNQNRLYGAQYSQKQSLEHLRRSGCIEKSTKLQSPSQFLMWGGINNTRPQQCPTCGQPSQASITQTPCNELVHCFHEERVWSLVHHACVSASECGPMFTLQCAWPIILREGRVLSIVRHEVSAAQCSPCSG